MFGPFLFSLPIMLFDSLDQDGVLRVPAGDAAADVGQFEGSVVALPPVAVSPDILTRRIVFHESFASAFPDSFSDFSKRKVSDRCVVLDFAPSDVALPLLCVSLAFLPHTVVSHASG